MKKKSFLLFLLSGLILASLFSACGGEPPTPTLSASDIITQSSAKMQALNSYHFLLDQVGGGTPVGMGIEMKKAEGDIVRPDRLQATITGGLSGLTLDIKIVSVSGKLMMTNPLTGKWEAPPAAFDVLSLFDPNTGVGSILKGLSNVSKLEDADAGGVPCHHLAGTITSEDLKAIAGSAAPGTAINAEVWIGKSDLFIREVRLTGKITASEVDGIVRILKLSAFDVPITIELPQ